MFARLRARGTAVIPLAALMISLAFGEARAASSGFLIESFGSDGIGVVDLSTGYAGAFLFNNPATNITVGGGYVYWQDGEYIYRANPDLSGVALIHQNFGFPTDIALEPAGVPEPATWVTMLVGFGMVRAMARGRNRLPHAKPEQFGLRARDARRAGH